MSWPEVDFESLFAAPSRNGVYKSKDHHGSGVPIVNMGELFAFNRIGNQPMSLIRMSDAEMDKSGLIDGDLLFGRRSLVEEGAGKCSIVYKPAGPLTFESSIIRVRLDRAIADPEFFFNYFRSPIGRSRIRAIVGGAAVKGIRGSDLKLIKVHVPPLDEQIAIRQVVALYDDLIATNQRRIALLEDAARRLYREWFVHLRFPGHESVPVKDGVPAGWLSLTLGDVCDAVGGGTPSTARPEYWGGDVTWVTPTDVTRNDCLVMLDSEKKITEAGLANSSAKLVPPETILMTSRASIGFFALMDKPACTNQGFISVLPKQDSARMFLLFNLLDRVEEMIGLATGATFKELSKKTFRALPVLWPTDALLKFYEDKTYPLIQQVRLIKKQNQELTKARDRLLPKLMSGQLDVSGIALPAEVAA
ncbi:type I restriction enzyme S subunit [Acidovorax temperans]|uniref:Type I restriction enzyme S subunit n=1 Tax=Acidovorax temperans TaxID=80878 RepID=A0A543LIJ8_9BURK|nr:restriction endonuclease subunit S [Acidovorax temperans]TQN07150.1 type I restriction enzyme S subunit [Acidovorax temperans]